MGDQDRGRSRDRRAYPTQGLAIATVWELARERTAVEVVVHGPDGSILSNLSIRHAGEELPGWEADFDQSEDEALRREAMRIMPSRAELRAMIGRLPPSSIDYSMEDDELPC